ncbi:MAG: glycosyltransferase [Desulfuromonadales bacterium]|nr:glycosyltransferase [Desulfuromonadales bacterium]
MNLTNKVLMIAYAFPPMPYAGVYRTLRFVKNLPGLGWQPLVLTLKECPDLERDPSLLDQIPPEARIYRTATIDPVRWLWRRQKSAKDKKGKSNLVKGNAGPSGNSIPQAGWARRIKDLILRVVSFPDHMIFWVPFAVARGILVMAKEKPTVIYSTSPPHSAHLSALILSWLFRKPWVADFRDAWGDADNFTEQCFESVFLERQALRIEGWIFQRATKVIMVSDLYRDAARKRYPNLDFEKFETITNGFDPDDVKNLEPLQQDKFTVVYTGAFYAYRQPDLFLDGLKYWRDHYPHDNLDDQFQTLFVGSTSDELRKKIAERGVENLVRLVGFVPKSEAMRYNLGAHLLLLIIGFNPGSEGILTSKIFDYFLCRKNILALVPEGEAAKLIRSSKTGYVISRISPEEVAEIIEAQFRAFKVNDETVFQPAEAVVKNYHAHTLTKELTDCLVEAVHPQRLMEAKNV